MRISGSPVLLVIAALLHAAAAFAQADAYADARRQFVQVYAGADKATSTADADSTALREYPLYPYLQAARIRAALDSLIVGQAPVDATAARFLTVHGEEPVGRGLRRDWLASLAARLQWSTYLGAYRDEEAEAAQRCHAFTARIELQRLEELRDAIIEQWLAATGSLMDCETAFGWLRAQGALTLELIEQRIRVALESGSTTLSKQLAAELPPERAAPFVRWIELIEDPQAAVERLLAAPTLPVEDAAVLDGWSRLCRKDPEVARRQYEALVRARGLTPAAASPYALALALGLAWNRSTHALQYFDRVDSADVDERAVEWHARAALWAGDWQRAANVIAAMPESLRAQSRWKYWAARTTEMARDRKAAKAYYEAVIPTDNYYAALAAARLHEPFAPHPRVLERNEQWLGSIAAEPAFVRARELFLSGLEPLAEAEWWDAQTRLDESAKRQSVHLAVAWEWYEAAIITAARQSFFEDYALLYPRPFDTEVAASAKQSDLPAELIYAMLRQESLYRPDAVSPAGAFGLLQLRPDTAARIARRVGRPAPTRASLLDPGTNIPLGAAELRSLLDRFDGQLPVALAGYNAGPNAAARWLPRRTVDADVWIENIPYNETRTYVQRVLWHSVVFAWLASGKAQDTRKWFARIGGGDEQASTLAQDCLPLCPNQT